jgi:hypothetical protein
MLTGVIHRTGVAPALLSDPVPRHPLIARSVCSIASLWSSLSASPMRFRPIGLLLFGIVALSSACSMDATAPSPQAPSMTAARASATWSGSVWSDPEDRGAPSAGGNGETSTYAVTIDPQHANVLRFGDYTLALPGNAICEQESGYGRDAFDLECKAEKHPVTIVAVVRSTANGIPRIDLMPEMRFSPKRVVTLSLFLVDAPAPASSPRILYCPTASTDQCIDEAQFDPTLATQVDAASNTVFRRIKHFSGYFVEW